LTFLSDMTTIYKDEDRLCRYTGASPIFAAWMPPVYRTVQRRAVVGVLFIRCNLLYAGMAQQKRGQNEPA
jgi:hypothetical protein